MDGIGYHAANKAHHKVTHQQQQYPQEPEHKDQQLGEQHGPRLGEGAEQRLKLGLPPPGHVQAEAAVPHPQQPLPQGHQQGGQPAAHQQGEDQPLGPVGHQDVLKGGVRVPVLPNGLEVLGVQAGAAGDHAQNLGEDLPADAADGGKHEGDQHGVGPLGLHGLPRRLLQPYAVVFQHRTLLLLRAPLWGRL